MKSFFNLLEEPWIPCIMLDGRMEQLSLRDTLVQAHTIREIYTDSPLTVAALHRLLLAVLHRVFGPRDRHVWVDLWNNAQGRWDTAKLDEYLHSWHSRFYLFDEQHPFYQVATLPPTVKPDSKPIGVLATQIASGHNVTLFSHHVDQEPERLPVAEAARRVITAQAYALGGGQSGIPGENFRHAPCAKGALFLVQGENLFQTLLLSMRKYPHSGSRLPDEPDKDRPAWEAENAFLPTRNQPLGYLDYLTWQSRRIKLVFPDAAIQAPMIERTFLTQGLGLDEAVLDPLKSYTESKEGKPIPHRFSEERSLWRDSIALFELSDAKANSSPENFRLLAELVHHHHLERYQRFRYLAIGMATGESGAGSAALWRYERMPLPLAYLADEAAVEQLRKGLDLAQVVDWRLGDACDWLTWLWLEPDAYERFDEWQKSKDHRNRGKNTSFTTLRDQLSTTQHYWWRLAQPFQSVLTGLAADDEALVNAALLAWRDTLQRTAIAAFQEITEGIEPSPRTLRAIVKAEAQLEWGLGVALKV